MSLTGSALRVERGQSPAGPGRKISIVIPVYNGANYLREAVESALAQSYPPYEVLVVNDASNDKGATEAIARSFGNRIKYLEMPTNGGVARALNAGIRRMSGDWFVWLSHDDVLAQTRLEEDVKLLDQTAEAKVTFSAVSIIDAAGNVTEELNYPCEQVNNLHDVFALSGVNFCSLTMHRTCFEAVGLFNESNRTTQDVEMTLRLARRFKFFFSRRALTYVREHGERGTHVMSEARREGVAMLCRFLHDELSLREFFPNIGADKSAVRDAWLWMEALYRGYGADPYAAECHRLATWAAKSRAISWLTTFGGPTRVLRQPAVERLVARIYSRSLKAILCALPWARAKRDAASSS